jgi:hypothetical protein
MDAAPPRPSPPEISTPLVMSRNLVGIDSNTPRTPNISPSICHHSMQQQQHPTSPPMMTEDDGYAEYALSVEDMCRCLWVDDDDLEEEDKEQEQDDMFLAVDDDEGKGDQHWTSSNMSSSHPKSEARITGSADDDD